MSYWNHRVVVDTTYKEALPVICEVYYNDYEIPFAYSEARVSGEDKEELLKEIDRFNKAIMVEWLYYPEDFEKEENND